MWRSLLFSALSVLSAGASPLIQNVPQKPFNVPTQDLKHIDVLGNDGHSGSSDVAMEFLAAAPSQLIETFEAVMSKLDDASKWALPQKEARPRLHDWDFTVSTSGLPQHSLRIKEPNSLGVDDVKQVYTYLCFVILV